MGDERDTESQKAVSTRDVALPLAAFVVSTFIVYWGWPQVSLMWIIAPVALFRFLKNLFKWVRQPRQQRQ